MLRAAAFAGGTSLRAAGLRDTGCWCCAHGMVRFPAGWFAAGVLQAAGEENKFWKIRDFVNSKFLKNFFFVMNHFKTPKISEVLF